MSIEVLTKFLQPPSLPIESKGSWSRAESKIGAKLPGDFKSYIETYGTGSIKNFITIFNPFSNRTSLNLAEQQVQQLDVLRALTAEFGEHCPFELFPTSPGLLPVGMTDNGDVIFWYTQKDPENWTIVVNESRSPAYEQFDCNLTTFLAGLLDGSIESSVFPKISGAPAPSFKSI